jgi:Transcription factor subunit Med10 of Mediator complex
LRDQREAIAVEVPVSLLHFVDEGGNPDVFTSEIFRQCLRENQAAKGKVEAFRCVSKGAGAGLLVSSLGRHPPPLDVCASTNAGPSAARERMMVRSLTLCWSACPSEAACETRC